MNNAVKKLLVASAVMSISMAPAWARFVRGSESCPALTVDQAITQIAESSYGPFAQTACFTKLLGQRDTCINSLAQYRDVIAKVAKTADFANDEVNMAVYQYARTDLGYGVLVDYRAEGCGRFVWNDD